MLQSGLRIGKQEYIQGFDAFDDKEETDVQILICPGMGSKGDQVSVVNHITGIAGTTRKDCMAVASPNRDAVVNNIKPVIDTLTTTNLFAASSYLAVDNNYLKVYDKYNDEYIYVPASSTTAGIFALTDYNYGPWWSPAGERRGEYAGVSGLAYSPNKSQRDELYKKGVNPIVQFPGRGTILFGDKTKLARPSAFDRINVRRLFLAIEKSIAEAARNFLFEFNDEFTRSEFVAIVEPLLREVQAKRGIQDFFVQCDDRNNTPEVIDRNELIASIFVKPARSINFITLNFVATRTGADFEEIIQSGIQF
jgi:phage tail sheath protein FI